MGWLVYKFFNKDLQRSVPRALAIRCVSDARAASSRYELIDRAPLVPAPDLQRGIPAENSRRDSILRISEFLNRGENELSMNSTNYRGTAAARRRRHRRCTSRRDGASSRLVKIISPCGSRRPAVFVARG
jgi:hypothetical protein